MSSVREMIYTVVEVRTCVEGGLRSTTVRLFRRGCSLPGPRPHLAATRHSRRKSGLRQSGCIAKGAPEQI